MSVIVVSGVLAAMMFTLVAGCDGPVDGIADNHGEPDVTETDSWAATMTGSEQDDGETLSYPHDVTFDTNEKALLFEDGLMLFFKAGTFKEPFDVTIDKIEDPNVDGWNPVSVTYVFKGFKETNPKEPLKLEHPALAVVPTLVLNTVSTALTLGTNPGEYPSPGDWYPAPGNWYPDPVNWFPAPGDWLPGPPRYKPGTDEWTPGPDEKFIGAELNSLEAFVILEKEQE